MSKVTILMTTYYPDNEYGKQRARVAQETLCSWEDMLWFNDKISPANGIDLCVVDDGSPKSLIDIATLLTRFNNYVRLQQQRHGCGASLNAGFRQAFENGSDIVLYAVDDWELLYDFDITPWVQLLEERDDVGMVRLGPPHPNLMGKVEIFTSNYQGWGLRLFRQGYAYGMRPALYHKRFIDAYGWFEEDVSTLECERLYNEKFCSMSGPDVVLALPHPWEHKISGLSDIDPRTEDVPR